MKPHISAAYKIFISGCDRAAGLCAIYSYLKRTGPAALECDDILRSSLALLVASFDLYIHDVYRTELINCIVCKKKLDYANVPFNSLISDDLSRISLVENHIRKQHAHKSFVAPDKMAECLSPIVEGIWDKVAAALTTPSYTCKARLRQIINLRNRIVHEADVNPDYGRISLWPIYQQDVESSIVFCVILVMQSGI